MARKLSHNTMNCIVTVELAVGRIVLQYIAVYCDRHNALFQSLFMNTVHEKKISKKKK